jgi:hypothetical protein
MSPDERIAYEAQKAEAVAAATRRGNPPSDASKMPSATETEALTNDATALSQVSTIDKLFKPEYVGPVSGRVGGLSMATGAGLTDERANFIGQLAIFRNAVIKAMSGATVSGPEEARMKKQIPSEEDPSRAFKSKLRQTEANLRDLATRRRRTMAETGRNMSNLSPLPGEGPPDPYAFEE